MENQMTKSSSDVIDVFGSKSWREMRWGEEEEEDWQCRYHNRCPSGLAWTSEERERNSQERASATENPLTRSHRIDWLRANSMMSLLLLLLQLLLLLRMLSGGGGGGGDAGRRNLTLVHFNSLIWSIRDEDLVIDKLLLRNVAADFWGNVLLRSLEWQKREKLETHKRSETQAQFQTRSTR